MHQRAFSRMKTPNSVIQRNEALKLCQMAHIDPQQPCGLDEVHKLHQVMPDYRICVFTDNKEKECVFKGDYAAGRKNLYLLLHKGHFSAIIYPCQAFDFHFDCPKCLVFYNLKGEHRCEGCCWRWLGPNPHDVPSLQLTRCSSCAHQFAGPECFETHRTVKLPHTDKTKCDSFRYCVLCEKSYSTARGRNHVCGHVYCKYCKNDFPENHLCFMQGCEGRDKKKTNGIMSPFIMT